MLRRVLLIIGGLILLLVVGLGVTLALLDVDGLIAKYKPKALAAASEAVGRPVDVKEVETQWFPDLAIVANGLAVESSTTTKREAPLFEARQLRLSLALWTAITSWGQRIEFDEIALVEPVIRVRQRPDGSWNYQGLGPQDEPSEPEPESQMTDQEQRGFIDYLERTTIARVAIEDGQLLYEDPQRSYAVQDIDFLMRDLSLGQPVSARVAFAFAADEQNVLVEAETEPLPKTLLGFVPPPVKTIEVHVDGMPLHGFLPEVAGYDLVRAALDVDVDVALEDEDVQVDGPITVGPINWVSNGQTGPSFSVMTTIGGRYELADDRIVLSGTTIEAGALVLELSGPVGLQPGVRGRVKVETKRAVRLPDLGPLAPGLAALPPAMLTVALDTDVDPGALTISDCVVGIANATVRGRARYPISEPGLIVASFETGEIDLPQLAKNVKLESVALPPGSFLALKGRYEGPTEAPAKGQLALSSVRFRAGESSLSASGTVTRFSPLAVEMSGTSPRLDLDALLPPPAEDPEEPTATTEPPGRGVEGVEALVALTVDRVIYAGATARDARVQLRLENQRVALERVTFNVFGGRVSASGTTVDLSKSPLAYDISAELSALQASQLLGFWSDSLGGALSGELSTQLELSGAGFEVASVAETLTGSLSMALANGELSGVDLVRSAAQPVAKALKAARYEPSEKLVTDFRKLTASFTVDDGRFVTTKPLQFDTPSGRITLQGNVGLDQSIDLSGDIGLSPDLIRSMTGGKIRPSEPIPIGVRLGCSLTSPCVKGIDAESAASTLLASAATEVVEKAKAEVREEVKKQIDEAEDRAKEEAESAAKKAADKAKEKAKKGLKSLFGR